MPAKRKPKIVPKPGSKYGTRTKRLSLKVTAALDKALRRKARKDGVTISDVVFDTLERDLTPAATATPDVFE